MYSTRNIFILGLVVAVCVGSEKGRLLKVPKIYNALITTDEELLPSQAYPAVSPVLHPTSHIFVEHKNIAPLAPLSDEPLFPPSPPPPPLIPVPPPVLEETPNVRNHRPADPAIPDVPPPPLPVSFKN